MYLQPNRLGKWESLCHGQLLIAYRFKSAYCSVLEKEACVDIFGEMDVMSDSLSQMADLIIKASS